MLVAAGLSPDRDGRVARTGLALAAGPVRTVGLLRRTPVNPRILAATMVDNLVQRVLEGRTVTLILDELRVSRELDVNLRLQGPSDRLSRVTGLALADGDGTVQVPTLRAQHGEALWLSATLPADQFDEPGSRRRLVLHGPDGGIRFRGGRTRLRHRWSRRLYRQDNWPVRVRLDWRRRLLVTGTRPVAPNLTYAVRAGPDTLTLLWDDPATALSMARFIHRGTGQVVVADGTHLADGRHSVTLDFERLVDPAEDWDIELLTSRRGPVRLRARPGTFPSLRSIVSFPEVSSVSRDGGSVSGTVRFSVGNTLVARVRPAADAA
ncbi:MAG TPA: hypothetical protein VIT20_07130 [Propionibacteriaceae bacterium]